MREPHKKGVAHHFGSESCDWVRKEAGDVLTEPAHMRWQRSPQREGGRPRGTHHKRTRAGHRAGDARL
jgi:hypothetical protein